MANGLTLEEKNRIAFRRLGHMFPDRDLVRFSVSKADESVAITIRASVDVDWKKGLRYTRPSWLELLKHFDPESFPE